MESLILSVMYVWRQLNSGVIVTFWFKVANAKVLHYETVHNDIVVLYLELLKEEIFHSTFLSHLKYIYELVRVSKVPW